ncbi:MAG: alpha/beta fold hydrolase, partial [Clostridia bacterium]|nr:alpha/beta fold hydrolase [Clostridia bacterium]
MICENIILGAGTKFPLKGVLTLPDSSAGPVPAVVLVHGSGSSNMDEKVMKLTPFRDLAEGLAERGVASVRYDKRSFAHGLKMIRDKSTPITVKQETIEDAILAAELLRQDARIDSGRICIIGHSMGGMLAPRIDAEGGNFAGLILLAGSPRPI